MKNIIKIMVVLPALLALAACSLDAPSDPTGDVNPPGPADATSPYVAIGNSLTAGYMDAGLMQAGQANSYPLLIASAMGIPQGGFTQPWVAAPGIGSSTAPSAGHIAGVLRFNPASGGIEILGETSGEAVPGLLLALAQPTQYNNLGVPGATLTDGMNAYSAATSQGPSPFFDFVNRAAFFGNEEINSGYPISPSEIKPVTFQSGSMFHQAIARGPAMMSVWLGNNDVLGSAANGTSQGITPPGEFQERMTDLLSMLAGGLAQRNGFKPAIVVANIPSVTDAPYFVPRALFDQAIGGGWPWGYEEADAEIVLFPTLSWVQDEGNQGSPIPASATLSAGENTDIATATATFNGIIAGVVAAISNAGAADIAVADMNAALAALEPPFNQHFLTLLQPPFNMDITTAAASTYFSLDGIHPNNKGYGYTANQFIATINELMGTEYPEIDLGMIMWDPTYGAPVPTKASGAPHLTAEAAAAMAAIWR